MGEWLTIKQPASVGEICELQSSEGNWVQGEIISSSHHTSRLMLFQECHSLRPGDSVFLRGHSLRIPAGPPVLGRVINALGTPLDGLGPIAGSRVLAESQPVASPLHRKRVTEPLCTGQRVIDGFLTLGKGQRVGVFAGSGVGKSTLLGEIAKHAQVDCNVVALVGERGREVLPFLEDALGATGRQRSVVVVATAEEPALSRVQAVKTAVRIAEEFRDAGTNVMFFLDSITRLAHAQREVGLGRGEPPGTRGYPPSVFRVLAQTLERLGNSEHGSITGLITVLVDGDDLAEPVSDAARSILDGHIVLSRKLAEQNVYPAVDVLASVSRLFREVTSADHQASAALLRQTMSTYAQMEELLRMGLYQPGASAETDVALKMMPVIRDFRRQAIDERSSFTETQSAMARLREQAARHMEGTR